MKDDKSVGMVAMVAIGSMAFLGYKYMACHPEVRNNMRNMAKNATKKLYQKLDEMD